MRGWQLTEVGAPLKLVEKPDPEPASGQVIIDVKAAGICHSDLGFLDGTLTSMLTHRPIILGHEVAGVISAVGPDVAAYAVGDRVGIAGLGLDAPGIVADGGFGEKVVGKVEQLVPIPEGVSFAQAAAGTDAGQTTRHALRVGGVGPGSRVGLIGLGGLGMTAARIAVLLGATVFAAEPNRGVWDSAFARGVTDVVDDVLAFASFDLDIIIDLAGFGTTTAGAIEVINPGGTVVQVGLGLTQATIDIGALVSKQVRLLGSLGGSYADTVDVYRLLGTGELEISIQKITFNDIPAGLQRLHTGGVTGRLVAEYP